jgi:hypothetical protein
MGAGLRVRLRRVLVGDGRGVIEPRWGTPRDDRYETNGERVAELALRFGVEMFEWQRLVADAALEKDDTGRYRYRTVGANVGRQNGKTLLAALRIALELDEPGRHVAFTAQDRHNAKGHWQEHCSLIQHSGMPIKRMIRGSGSEKLEMENGSTYSIFTPTGTGARGMTLDLVIIDECLSHDFSLLGAVEPTMATRPNGQLWLLSNAGDMSSTLLNHYRQLGHAETPDPAQRLAWFEWAPHEERFDPGDPAVWREAIPTIDEDAGVFEDAVAQAAATQPADVFAKEWLNVWASTSAVAVIDPAKWEACQTGLVPPPAGLTFGLDVSSDRDRATIAVSGQTQGRQIVEIIDSREGVGWVHDRVIQLCRDHRATIVIDGGATAAGSFIAPLEQDGVKVVIAKTRDYANACGMFYDATEAGMVGHPGDERLSAAVAVAGRRKLGDTWAWQRRADADMTPLVAATLAHWAAVTVRAPKPAVL